MTFVIEPWMLRAALVIGALFLLVALLVLAATRGGAEL